MKVIAKNKIKDVLLTRTAIKCLTSDHIVEKIVKFQGKDAAQAVKLHKEVEFVGFGKFMTRGYKIERRIESLEKGLTIVEAEIVKEADNEARVLYLNNKLKAMNEKLLYLKNKLNNEQADRVDEVNS